jgi:predicted nucleotidyltransferase
LHRVYREEKIKTKIEDKKDKMPMELEEICKKILPVLRRAGVKTAAIFGSYGRGEELDESDVDLIVEFEGEKSLLDLVGLELELVRVIGRSVDVVTYNSLHPLLRERIIQEQQVIL